MNAVLCGFGTGLKPCRAVRMSSLVQWIGRDVLPVPTLTLADGHFTRPALLLRGRLIGLLLGLVGVAIFGGTLPIVAVGAPSLFNSSPAAGPLASVAAGFLLLLLRKPFPRRMSWPCSPRSAARLRLSDLFLDRHANRTRISWRRAPLGLLLATSVFAALFMRKAIASVLDVRRSRRIPGCGLRDWRQRHGPHRG